MRIAYLGLDEVNRYFVRKWARRIAAGIAPVNVQGLGISSKYAAVVVDIDSLPMAHRLRWIGWLTSFACRTRALVFGHTLNDEESNALRSCGVRVIDRALHRRTLQRWMEREILCAA